LTGFRHVTGVAKTTSPYSITARRKSRALRDHPDLEEMHGIGPRAIELGVGYSGARRHALQFTEVNPRTPGRV